MKKSSLTAMVLGTVSGVLFALGICMALIPEWEAFVPGIICGCVGLLLGIITWVVWRKMEHKAPIHISGRTIFIAVLGIVGSLVLGAGMCLSMVWGQMVVGIVLGVVGIAVLLSLIPVIKGIKE